MNLNNELLSGLYYFNCNNCGERWDEIFSKYSPESQIRHPLCYFCNCGAWNIVLDISGWIFEPRGIFYESE